MRKLLFVAVALTLLGCRADRYELVSSEGVAYRLDRSTGEVVFIQGSYGSVVLMPSEKEMRENTDSAAKAAEEQELATDPPEPTP